MTQRAEYLVRPAGRADLNQLVVLISALRDHIEASNPDLWRQSPDSRRDLRNRLSTRLRAAGSCALVAEHAIDGAVGTIFGRVLTNKRYLPSVSGSIDQLFVLPEHRRRGVGTRLLAGLCDFFAAEGVEALSLRYVAGNDEAARFWQSFGFQPRIISAGTQRHTVHTRLLAVLGPSGAG